MRTTKEQVREIIDTGLEDNEVDAFISGANSMVNAYLAGEGLSSTLLEEIERWLAAHMIASTREPAAKRQEAGTAKIEYFGQYGMGLDSTAYGQMVKSLDTSGKMAAASKKKVDIRFL